MLKLFRMLDRAILVALLAIFFTVLAFGQQANINAPLAGPTETKILVQRFDVKRTPARAVIELSFQDAGSNEIERRVVMVPADDNSPGTELSDLLTAMVNPRTGETGASARRMNFRVLGYLSDAGRLSGVTLQP